MEGFVSVLDTRIPFETKANGVIVKGDGCAHNVATFFLKLRVDDKNDVYVNSHHGALVGNVDRPIKSVEELCRLSGLPSDLANQRFKRFEMLLSRNAFQTSRLETIVLSQFRQWINNQ